MDAGGAPSLLTSSGASYPHPIKNFEKLASKDDSPCGAAPMCCAIGSGPRLPKQAGDMHELVGTAWCSWRAHARRSSDSAATDAHWRLTHC